jgi:hypothetical protein
MSLYVKLIVVLILLLLLLLLILKGIENLVYFGYWLMFSRIFPGFPRFSQISPDFPGQRAGYRENNISYLFIGKIGAS